MVVGMLLLLLLCALLPSAARPLLVHCCWHWWHEPGSLEPVNGEPSFTGHLPRATSPPPPLPCVPPAWRAPTAAGCPV